MIALMVAEAPDWVITWRDSAVTIAAICGALVTITAAAHLPVVRIPVRWVGRTLIGPAAEAYWRRVRYEAAQALSPELVGRNAWAPTGRCCPRPATSWPTWWTG